jgi:PTS system nitrogen regulatory IIA component
MIIADFLAPNDVMVDIRAADKVRLLQELSYRAAATRKLDGNLVASDILKRETLGSTGMGGGVAIPHARIPGLNKPFGLLVRLKKPIEFDAIDGKPVDLVFLLLLPAAPEGEQLNALASVARKLRDETTLRDLRVATDNAALYHAIVNEPRESKSGSA